MADNNVTQNKHGQWTTTDVYGGQTPHRDKASAERVAASPERG